MREITQKEVLSGKVRITAAYNFGANWLVPRLKDFNHQYPDIQVDLVVSDQALDLIEYQIDLAVRVGPVPDDSLIIRPLFTTSPLFYASKSYLSNCSSPPTLETLDEHQWLLLPQIHKNQQVELMNGARSFRFYPTRHHICDSPGVIQMMIAQGMGIGIYMPELLNDEDKENLVQCLLGWSASQLQASLVYPSRKQMPKRLRYLIDFLLASVP